MTVLPTIDLFPTFADTLLRLKNKACQCIWYLPDKRRCCLMEITEEDKQLALQLVHDISKVDSSTDRALQALGRVAEQNCYTRHHRNKIWGSDLAKGLAIRWQNEIRIAPSGVSFEIAQPAKPTSPNTLHTQDLTPTIHSPSAAKPITFAKHEVLEEETLISKLSSSIDSQAGRTGSLYIFTYKLDRFSGLIKIGYTCKSIDTRLRDWNSCGHGYPYLSGSFSEVRHPERVEVLTHFELLEYWYAQRWCDTHRRAHIEWFKIDIKTACSIAYCWSSWTKRANPYDRRGHLKSFWKHTLEFLTKYGILISAKLMMQIQELEEGRLRSLDFMDDGYTLCKPIKVECTAGGDLEVKPSLGQDMSTVAR